MEHSGRNMRKAPATIAFGGPVTLRRGASRTIGGVVYHPGTSYAPDDPGVLASPLFFILATQAPAPERFAPLRGVAPEEPEEIDETPDTNDDA